MKSKIFYGWYIVAIGLFLSFYNGAFFGFGWTAFLNPLLATFGWTMAQVSLASSLRSVESGVFNPVWGAVVDRFSPRNLMLIGVVATTAGILLIYKTTNLVMFYAGFLVMGLGSSLVMMIPTVSVTKWFKGNLGKANGIMAMGIGLGGVVLPLVVKMIDKLSWQTTLLIAAIGWAVIGIPLALVLRNPSPDPNLVKDANKVKEVQSSGPTIGIKAAIKMRAFWHINLAMFVQILISTVPMLFIMPYFTSIGISRATASTTVLLYTLVSFFVRLPFGWLADKYRPSYLIAISIATMGLSLFIFSRITAQSSFWFLLLFAVPYGIGLSGMTPLRPPILREYFGTKNFGTIYGVSSIFQTVGGVLAPVTVGLFITKYGNYGPIFLGSAAFSVVGIIIILTIPLSAARAKNTV